MTTKPFADEVIEILRRYCNIHFGGNVRAFSLFLGIDPDSGVVHRWLRGTSSGPTLSKIGPVLDKLNIILCDPNDSKATQQTPQEKILQKENEKLQEELKTAESYIQQLTGERNAFKDIALTLSQSRSNNENSFHITNNNKNITN